MEETLIKLNQQGFCIIPGFAEPSVLEEIERELYEPSQFMNFNNECGFSILGGDRWILNPLIYSYHIAKLASDKKLIQIMSEMFGSSPVVGECSVHLSDTSNAELEYHSDRAGGILAYIFLSEMTDKNGQFCLIPGTHRDGSSDFWVPKYKLSSVGIGEVEIFCSRGDLLLFDQDIWHRRKSGAPGRKVIKILYQPVGKPENCSNQIFSQNVLSRMSYDELEVFGLSRNEQFSRSGLIRGSRIGITFGALKLLLKARRLSPSAVKCFAERIKNPWASKTLKKYVRIRAIKD